MHVCKSKVDELWVEQYDDQRKKPPQCQTLYVKEMLVKFMSLSLSVRMMTAITEGILIVYPSIFLLGWAADCPCFGAR